jgi:hypothetical protein
VKGVLAKIEVMRIIDDDFNLSFSMQPNSAVVAEPD